MANHTEYERAPFIITTDFPEPERTNAWYIISAISSLHSYVRHFEASLRLFDYRPSLDEASHLDAELYSDWRWIAARSGGLQIYHLGSGMIAIQKALKKCPTFLSLVNENELAATSTQLEQFFPNYTLLRHLIVHQAELVLDAMGFAKHAVADYRGPEVNPAGSGKLTLMSLGSLSGRTFRATFRENAV
ncbi:MAG TPA: hypothetical protein VN980_11230, partial [Alphaproteobacteria bacterium]|nr:hypothetical protein [Alphaproteobacteria bacterium]